MGGVVTPGVSQGMKCKSRNGGPKGPPFSLLDPVCHRLRIKPVSICWMPSENNSNRLAAVCTAAILLRLAVASAHGWAHEQLPVPLETWQRVFVMAVVVTVPICCVPLLWTRRCLAATGIAALAFGAALLFGLYFHFLANNPDHVAHVAAGPARDVFISTAALLVLVETAGAILCGWSWMKLRQTDATPAKPLAD